PPNLSQRIQGDADFVLRRIQGLPDVASGIVYRAASGQQRISAGGGSVNGVIYTRGAQISRDYTVSPEELYPATSEIGFDLFTVARAFTACGAAPIFTSNLYFQGVRRIRGEKTLPQTEYSYWEKPYNYHFDLVVDWRRYVSLPAAVVEIPRRFVIQIVNFDFE